jgi:hypothetical protein
VVTRFKVTCVTGWPINQGSHGASGSKEPAAIWQVLDTANCCHVIREFRCVWTYRGGYSAPLAEAVALAARLEQECW